MMRGWEGKPSKLVCFIVLPRKRVLFVVNLTHEGNHVQFSSVGSVTFFAPNGSHQLPRCEINLPKYRGLRRKLIDSAP